MAGSDGGGEGGWKGRAVREVRAVQLAARVGQSGVWRFDAVAASGNGNWAVEAKRVRAVGA
jgi:hypothetical protein